MRSRASILLLFALIFTISPVFRIDSFAALGVDKTVAKKGYKAGEILVKFKPGARSERRADLHRRLGAQVEKTFTKVGVQQVKIKKGMAVEEAIAKYKADPAVEYAEPNYEVTAEVFPFDPKFAETWAFYNAGNPAYDINGPEAWDIHTGDRSVVVAVIDTGVDYNHPDLSANMWVNEAEYQGRSGVDDDGNGYIDDLHGIDTHNRDSDPLDDHSHGTHVAGTIGAVGNNGIGVAGVNWQVQIMACKFMSASGSGWITDAMACVEYVKEMKDRGHNIVATNNSWGGGGYSQAMADTIAAQSDILFMAAAGNDGTDNDIYPHYPSNYPQANVISVAATDRNDNLAYFSNYGDRTVHIGAPGSNILSTVPGNRYGYMSGTSMATPHVAGLAGLIKAVAPTMTAADIKNVILTTGDPLPASAASRVVKIGRAHV